MAITIAIPAECAFSSDTAKASITPEHQHKNARAVFSRQVSRAEEQEIFLPTSIRREMLGFFSVEELLTVEQVDTFWRRTLRDSGKWSTFSLTHDNDAQKNEHLIRRVAFAHGTDVERLELINCMFSNELIVEIGARFSNLKELVVSGCKMLSDEALAILLRASRHSLVEVRAVKCPLLTDDTLQVLGTCQSESIERVDFSHCRLMSSEGINVLVRQCTKLSELGFKGCPKVNDAAILAIATHCGSKLRRVSVGGSGNVSDQSLQVLADHCSGLKELDIARSNPFGIGRGGVSNQGLLYLVSKCRDLQRLVLRGQGQLSLSVLSSIAACCPKLQSLDIGGCRQIIQDPIALSVELKRMSLLEQLSVSFARGLKDEHINCIAAQCPQLKRFEVDGSQVAVSENKSGWRIFLPFECYWLLQSPGRVEVAVCAPVRGGRAAEWQTVFDNEERRATTDEYDGDANATPRALQERAAPDGALQPADSALARCARSFAFLELREYEDALIVA